MRRLLSVLAAALLVPAPAHAFELGFQDDPIVVRDPLAYGGAATALLGRGAAFAAARDLHMRVVRVNVFWNRVEDVDGGRDFSRYDRAVSEIAAARLVPQLTLTGPAPGGRRPRPERFAAFARAAAQRWAPYVRTWSIWNEPNWRGYLPVRGKARLYRDLFIAGASAIRTVDARSRVLIGELAPMGRPEAAVPPLRFLRGVLSAGRARLVADGLALHPYTLRWGPRFRGPGPDDLTTGSLGRAKRFLRIAARRRALTTPAGRALPLFLTEYGWHANSRRIPEALRAHFLRTGLALARRAGARQVVWYQLAGPPARRDGRRQWDTALLDADGHPRPAYRALWRFVRQ